MLKNNPWRTWASHGKYKEHTPEKGKLGDLKTSKLYLSNFVIVNALRSETIRNCFCLLIKAREQCSSLYQSCQLTILVPLCSRFSHPNLSSKENTVVGRILLLMKPGMGWFRFSNEEKLRDLTLWETSEYVDQKRMSFYLAPWVQASKSPWECLLPPGC